MRILFISTVPVFPPSDGVRIPPAHYIQGLSETHEIDFLLLVNSAGEPPVASEVKATRARTRHFSQMSINRGSKFTGLVREFLCVAPYYGFWELDGKLPEVIAQTDYDAVFTCTLTATGIFGSKERQKSIAGDPIWVAAISDVHSLVIARLAANASKNHRILTRTVQRFAFAARSNLLAKSEMKMLMAYDYHFVQTEKEVEWIKQKGTAALHRRSVEMPNAVNDQLFSIPVQRETNSIVFVGVLSALYAGRFEWFIHQVWRLVDRVENGLSLTAIGRGANEALRQSMAENEVEYVEFVEDLSDIYREHDVLIAPIFKGFGLINKVVEAMAAGCVVVGDATAFNGIPEFVAGQHGFVADTAEEFQEILRNDLADPNRLNEMRQAARSLMEKHFRWSQRIKQIERTVLQTER
ncbi:MAG: glycosyltransferase family 4 protein [Planctomycetota bacterium]